MRIIRLVESSFVFWLSVVLTLAVGVASMLYPSLSTSDWTTQQLWQNREGLLNALTLIYMFLAMRWAFIATPRLLQRLRPASATPQSQFDLFASHIAGKSGNQILLLTPPTLTVIALYRFVMFVLLNGAPPGEMNFGIGILALPAEIAIGVVGVWRMFWLWRLSNAPIQLNLLDASPVYPFGGLSFLYASLLSIRMALRYIFFGNSIIGMMAFFFAIFAVISLLMLIVPIWGVHTQMSNIKANAIRNIDSDLQKITQPLFSSSPLSDAQLAAIAQSTQPLYSLRDRIAQVQAWPVPNSFAAAQALFVSSMPALLPVAKQYLLPMLGLS